MKGKAVHPKKIQEKAGKLIHPGSTDGGAGSFLKKREAGGAVQKNVGGPAGAKARKHGGRAARKGGGSCEASPFSSAHGKD